VRTAGTRFAVSVKTQTVQNVVGLTTTGRTAARWSYAVVLDRDSSNDRLGLWEIVDGSWTALAEDTDATVSVGTWYTVKVACKQGQLIAGIVG